MMRTMLKSKIHRATVTDSNLSYEGSISIDPLLLKAADILPFEKVEVLNVNNGSRIETYAIEGKKGSGMICLNGAAARSGCVGDLVIIVAYALVEESETAAVKTKIIKVDGKNRIRH